MKGFIKSIYKSISDFYLPEHKEKDAEQTEPLSSVSKEKSAEQKAREKKRVIGDVVGLAVFSVLLYPVIAIGAENDERNFQNNWTVLSEQKATVVSTQFVAKPHDSCGKYTPYVTILTESGDTVTFSGYATQSDDEPIAGLSAGDACTIYKKQYHGVTYKSYIPANMIVIEDGETAWFINDDIVFYYSVME